MSLGAYGQYNPNLPLGALPMQYNGSFAGEANSPRISSNFGFRTRQRYVWGGDRYHQHVSYDQFIPSLSTGIGVGVYGVQGVSLSYKEGGTQGFYLALAPKISLKGKWTLSPSLDLEYGRSRMPSLSTMIADTVRTLYGYNSTQWGSRAGLLINTSKFYIGYSVGVANHFNIDYANGGHSSGRLAKFSSYLQVGYTFQKRPESDFSFTPQLTFYIGNRQYLLENGYDRFGINFFQGFNLNFRYRQFIWGINNTGLHLGWQSRGFRVMASNGMAFGGGANWHYVGNISLRYAFRSGER